MSLMFRFQAHLSSLCHSRRLGIPNAEMNWLTLINTTNVICKLSKIVWLEMYQTLHIGFPKYFAPHLSFYPSSYSASHNQSNFSCCATFHPSTQNSLVIALLCFPLLGMLFLMRFACVLCCVLHKEA